MPRKKKLPSRESLSKMDRDSLATIVASFGKQANQRLRQIESSGFQQSSQAYGYLESEAYSKKGYLTQTGAGEIKFNVQTRSLNRNELLSRATNIMRFLESATSTISGTKAVFKHNYENYAKKYNSQLTQQEFGAFWKSGIVQKFSEIFTSEQAVRLAEKTKGMDIDLIEGILRAGGLNEKTQPGDLAFEDVNAMVDTWIQLGAGESLSDEEEDDPWLMF